MSGGGKETDERHGQREPGASTAIWRNVAVIAFFVRYRLTPVEATTAGRVLSNPPPLRHSHQGLPASKLTGTSRSHSGTLKPSSIRRWRFQRTG
jgi:hypothetical protein